LFLAKVDATEAREVASQHEVTGYPTIKFFKNGSAKKYEGGRDASSIVNWYVKKTGPVAKTVSSSDDVTALKEKHEVVVFGVFEDIESEAAKSFLGAASEVDDVVFAIGSSSDIGSHLEVEGDHVVVLKDFDEKRNEMSLSGDQDIVQSDITSFVKGASLPNILRFSPESSSKIFGAGIDTHFLFFTNEDDAHHEGVYSAIETVAPQHQGNLLFVYVPGSEAKVAEYFGFKSADFPKAVILNMSKGGMKKFVFSGDLSQSDEVQGFLESYNNGELTPTLKSEEPSEDDDANAVKVLVGKTFNDKVVNNEKDVLVEFYAPWCGHCKNLAPIWDELGESLADEENIVIAKMDSTANEIDVDGVTVTGFPTIYFFKGNDKSNPQRYEGGRDYESFVSFLQKNAAHSFTKEL
jgi:protein disulfide-isomerase A1